MVAFPGLALTPASTCAHDCRDRGSGCISGALRGPPIPATFASGHLRGVVIVPVPRDGAESPWTWSGSSHVERLPIPASGWAMQRLAELPRRRDRRSGPRSRPRLRPDRSLWARRAGGLFDIAVPVACFHAFRGTAAPPCVIVMCYFSGCSGTLCRSPAGIGRLTAGINRRLHSVPGVNAGFSRSGPCFASSLVRVLPCRPSPGAIAYLHCANCPQLALGGTRGSAGPISERSESPAIQNEVTDQRIETGSSSERTRGHTARALYTASANLENRSADELVSRGAVCFSRRHDVDNYPSGFPEGIMGPPLHAAFPSTTAERSFRRRVSRHDDAPADPNCRPDCGPPHVHKRRERAL